MDATQDEILFMSKEEIRQARPFYLILVVVAAVLYGVSLYSSPDIRTPIRLIPFTLLFLAHTSLHWISPYLPYRRKWIVPYFLLQGALLFAINYMAPGNGLNLGLYLAMAGEAVGILRNLRLAAIPALGYLLLAGINFGLSSGWENILLWLALFGPMAFFVVIYVSAFTLQTRERRKSEQLLRDLEAAHEKLREYAAQVEKLTLAEERQRMARELHDTLAQGLAGLILQLEAIDSHLNQGHQEQAQAFVQQAMLRARSTLADARRAIVDLRTGSPSPEDLQQAIRWEVSRFKEATGIDCSLNMQLPAGIPSSVSEGAKRAVSEGLSNIARHAQAKRASVDIETTDGMLVVTIQDDGVGLRSSVAESKPGHYGLTGLRERARMAGGTFEINSQPGEGTRMALRLPLETEGEAE